MWYWEGQFGKLQQRFKASGADNWAFLGRGFDFIIQGCLSSWAAFFHRICVSPTHFSHCPAQMHVKLISLFSPFRRRVARWRALLSPPATSPKRFYFSMQTFIPSLSLSSNNAAVTLCVVIAPSRQQTRAGINTGKIPEIFHPTSYQKREQSHGAVLSFWKGSICRTKYRNRTAGWVKRGKKVSLRNLCAVEEASVYLYFPTLVRCDKEKKGRHARSLLKFIRGENKTKSRSNRKSFIAGLSVRLAGFEIYEFTQTGCIKQGQNPPATPLSLQKQTVLRSACCSDSKF